jgi:hypothetical protein
LLRLRIKRVGILFPLLVLWSCGAGDSMRIAEGGVERVHQQMNAEQFTDIYAEADPALRASSASQDFLDFMTAVHRKLGNVQSAKRTHFFVNFTTAGTRVTLNYETKFGGGDAQEEFVWAVSGKQAKLFGYHINSMALILK